jgi:hypothetical protein
MRNTHSVHCQQSYGALTLHDTTAVTEHTSIHIVARRRHSQCTKQLAGVAHGSDFNVQYNTTAQNNVRGALEA